MKRKGERIQESSLWPVRPVSTSRKVAFAAILCALGVVILYMGALFDVLDLSAAALATMLVTVALTEMGGTYAWLVYAVTGVLALLLLPQKFGAIVYVGLAGYYPMLKRYWERFRKPFAYSGKIAQFAVALTVLLWFTDAVLHVPGMNRWYVIGLYAVGVVTFLIFDVALTLLTRLYRVKFRHQFGIDRLMR